MNKKASMCINSKWSSNPKHVIASCSSNSSNVSTTAKVRPFLKWAGGKRRLLAQYAPYLPTSFGRYHEPFVGGGAFFFHLNACEATLSDINPRLIETYQALKVDIEGVLERLVFHREHHSEKHFYACRDALNHGDSLWISDRAALMIYLNKTCFNGLYRENSKGFFNVPMGRYTAPKIFKEENLRTIHKRLQHVELYNASFERVAEHAQKGDLVFFDPPYVPLSETSSFMHYTKNGFGADEQRRLAELFRVLSERGCYVMLSNSDCGFVRDLYKDWRVVQISAARCINSRASRRGSISEVLVLGW